MRTLFKKSLAFCLVASLALTCFIGSFSVSAATYPAFITVADTTITQGDTTADIIIQISSPDVGINEARLQVSSSVGTISTEVSLVKDASGTSYTPEELAELDFEVAHDVADDGVTISDYNSFWLSGKTDTTAITSAFIKVTFNVSPSKKAAPYPVSIYAPSEDIKVIASSPNEDIISFDTSNVGNVVVVHTTHTFVYTPNEGDTHTYDCSSCENFDPVSEDCTDSDSDDDTLCDKCGQEVSQPVDYDITTTVKGIASRLVEPWGMKYTVEFAGSDFNKVSTFGIALVLQKDYVDSFKTNPASMVASDVAYKFTNQVDAEYQLVTVSSSSTKAQYSALLTEGIKSQNMGDNVYLCPYAVMEDGTYEYGTVNGTNMLYPLNYNASTSTTVSAQEKQVCKDMISLYNNTIAYFEGKDIDSLTAGDVIPSRGTEETAATSWTHNNRSIIAVSGISSRLVEPWGIKYSYNFYADEVDGEVVDQGMVILNGLDYLSEYSTNPEAMRLHENAYIFSQSANTVKGSGTAWSAMLTKDVYVYNISTNFYVAPFVKLSDGSYVYGPVGGVSMDWVINTNATSTKVSDEEKAVGASMQSLYSSVCAYYDVEGWPSFIRR